MLDHMDLMVRLKRYFDLRQPLTRNLQPRQLPAVFPQYAAVALGVIAEPYLSRYIETGLWPADVATLGGRVVFGLLVAIILLPAVYKSAFDPQKPVAVQLAALFPMGIGWQSLVNVGGQLAK
jgi:hypothetical protein